MSHVVGTQIFLPCHQEEQVAHFAQRLCLLLPKHRQSESIHLVFFLLFHREQQRADIFVPQEQDDASQCQQVLQTCDDLDPPFSRSTGNRRNWTVLELLATLHLGASGVVEFLPAVPHELECDLRPKERPSSNDASKFPKSCQSFEHHDCFCCKQHETRD